MSELLKFLRTHKLAWILPILLVAAVAVAVAWKIARTPANPYVYDAR